mgnify:CR=1 FL=1
MNTQIPQSIIGLLSEELPKFETHASIDSLFLYADAPSPIPDGSKPVKVKEWLFSVNKKSEYPLNVLGIIIEKYMDSLDEPSVYASDYEKEEYFNRTKFRETLISILERNGLKYFSGKVVQMSLSKVSTNLYDLIKDKNEERKLLNEYYDLGKLQPSALTGMELYQVSYQAQFKFDREELKKSLRKIIDDTKLRYEKGESPVKKDAPRILITGSPIGGCTNKIINTIEESGGSIVAYELCSSIRNNRELVDENNPDVYDALAKKYLNIGCACMMNNDKRIQLIDELIEEFKIDGVIDIALQSCHPFNVESNRIKEFVVNDKKIHYMAIETDYSQSDTEQLRTRFEAFIEMIES